jgi:hypothetical protein
MTRALPATGFTPFEEFPSPAAAPHHCGRCPPVVIPNLPMKLRSARADPHVIDYEVATDSRAFLH